MSSHLALVWGRLPGDAGTVDAPLGRHPGDRLRVAVQPRGKRAVVRKLKGGRRPAPTLNGTLDNSYLDETENSNLATDPAHASLLAELEAMLKEEVTKWIV